MTMRSLFACGTFMLGLSVFSASPSFAQTGQTTDDRAVELRNRTDEAIKRMNALQQANLEQARKAVLMTDKRTSVSGLSAVLVAGSLQSSTTVSADDIPAPARKALADMKDFLPYKSYQLVDAAWLRGTGTDSGGGILRLRGVEGQIYRLDLAGLDATLSVGVRLSEDDLNASASPAGSSVALATVELNARTVEFLKQQRVQLVNERYEFAQRYLDTHPKMVEVNARLADLNQKLAAAQVAGAAADRAGLRTLMNTRFQLEVGETVVVGTSRVNGDKALILLLTAVGK